MVKKNVWLWNRSIMMSELDVRPILRCWAKIRTQTRKIGLQGIQLMSSIPFRNGKKTCHGLESLNSDVRDRSYVEITILGQNEHETDTKNRSSTNSAYELTNPLKMVKNQFRLLNSSILMSELRFRPTYYFGPRSTRNGREKSNFNEFSFSAHEPLRNGKKNI